MNKRIKSITFRVLSLVVIMVCLLVGLSLLTSKVLDKQIDIKQYIFSKNVEEHRLTVERYAAEHDVEQHIDVLLAMMMQESGGRGDDPMQSSESLCGQVGCIDDPELSIKQGVTYFSKALENADGDIELAVQSYNFGIGFINYVKKESGIFNQDIAIQFSKEMYMNAEDQSIYTCLREGAKEFDACYGDIYYARDVMKYRDKFVVK